MAHAWGLRCTLFMPAYPRGRALALSCDVEETIDCAWQVSVQVRHIEDDLHRDDGERGSTVQLHNVDGDATRENRGSRSGQGDREGAGHSAHLVVSSAARLREDVRKVGCGMRPPIAPKIVRIGAEIATLAPIWRVARAAVGIVDAIELYASRRVHDAALTRREEMAACTPQLHV